jgi:hypothetical protein
MHPLCDPQLLWEQMIEAHASGDGDGKLSQEHEIGVAVLEHLPMLTP